ncbi:RNA polymerase II transcriptional coactivator-like [Corticium candelabrum]|uniref:RNA polymerase II transcriptional coactivator-like n=1 Tax=Corticium candelabrum TaxID=121492 RepID=UPI002E255BB9|nr:RNA polymerase II transcriptional coactivator-like [Corticium candelabrum]
MATTVGKKKKVTSSEFVSSDEDRDTDQEPLKKKKKTKAESSKKTGKPQLEFDLDKKRRVTISSFKGQWRVDIREFYEDDGQLKPGRKGKIQFSSQQYNE